MAEPEGIPIDAFRALVQRADLDLTDDELQALKPMYDHYAGQLAALRGRDLGAEDLSVVFSPDWNPQDEVRQ
jgi:hypothetical protein